LAYWRNNRINSAYNLIAIAVIEMEKEKSFYDKVYEVARQIPEGKVTSYGAIARYLGSPQSARMVGWAMNNASKAGGVPAHRVVNRIGMLSGKHNFPGTDTMQRMLESEGIEIVDNQVQNYEQHFWDPMDLLK